MTETPEGWPESIVLTLTPSQEAGGLVDTAEPLAVALEEALGIDVEAIVPSDYAGVIVALQSGQAQIAGGLGPSQMVQAADTAGADLILQAVRFGDSQYVTQWFTNDPDTFCADEPVDVPDDDGNSMLFCNGVDAASGPSDGPIAADQLPNVAGNTVAFVDQGSTSGYLIPSLGLLEAGVDPIEDIETLFAGGHDLSVQAVYDGDAQVGVSFNDARGQLVETVPDVGEKVVVFGWSSPIPNDGFAVAGDLPDDLKTAITDALVAYAESEDGAVVMDELYEIDGLVPVPGGSYDIIRGSSGAPSRRASTSHGYAGCSRRSRCFQRSSLRADTSGSRGSRGACASAARAWTPSRPTSRPSTACARPVASCATRGSGSASRRARSARCSRAWAR
jgi:phosphonate transport system substrate-binding protein